MSECRNCGDVNHMAAGEVYCHACKKHKAELDRANETYPRCPGIRLSLSYFEASMLLSTLAVAKAGDSKYDAADVPLRRSALERAYAKLSLVLGEAHVE